ncbi:DUF4136 domain-containing protein [uncultured Winogradskyella sp.]|uniref:DUF4136 domain-containing protein n=1 Tax=uncultured Winogradskyella sp. TaxID=395353 RepID=UPI003516D97A
MKLLSRVLLFGLFVSCGPVINYDYERSVDFDSYKTYNYFDDMVTGFSDLDTKRLIRSIDEVLQAKGLERKDGAQFYIDIQSQEIANNTNSNVGVGVGGTGGNVGGGVTVGIPLNSNQFSKEIVIEFVDLSTIGTFWQVIIETTFNPDASPEKREAQFKALSEKVFSGYPPQKN